MKQEKPKLIIITGPTASGKSTLAIDLARQFTGEIINADSMQVYRGMDVGTAKPSIEERKGVPHHLLDVVDPDREFNASLYRVMADPLVQDICARGRICFVVGGTGLYIKTLLGGLIPCPPRNQEVRESLRRDYEKYGSHSLHERLQKLDPEAAQRLHPHDVIRLMRALEIIALTNEPVTALMRNHGFKEQPFVSLKLCLSPERSELYERINHRSIIMMESGLVEETTSLLERGYSPELKSMKSLGYRHVVQYIAGAWDMDTTVQRLQRDTRRYAKRQVTWFRADPAMHWIHPQERDTIDKRIREFI